MSKAEKIIHYTSTTLNLSSSPWSSPTLAGDTYDYFFIGHIANASADSILDMTLNSDTTANYRNYEMKGLSSTASAATGDSDTAIELQNAIGTANPNLIMMSITGDSAGERYVDITYSADGAILKQSSYWKDTSNELTSITMTAASSVTCDVEFLMYRIPKSSSQGSWELMEVQTVTTQNINSTPIDFTSIDGDSDKTYKVTLKGSWVSGSGDIGIRVNSDTGTNYTKQRLKNSGGVIGAQNLSESYGGVIRNPIANTQVNASAIVYAETGQKRLINSSSSGTGLSDDQNEIVTWYSDTGTNITSLQIQQVSGSPSFTGTAKLYRLKNPNGPTGDTLPFETMKVLAVSGDFSAGSTWSSLTGDSTTLYKISGLFSTVGNDLRLQYNADTGSNYTDQYLKGVSGTASAASSTTTYHLVCDASASKVASFDLYIYPTSGENRPALLRVQHGEDSVEYKSFWWANTADELTAIKIFASSTTTCTGTLTLSRLV